MRSSGAVDKFCPLTGPNRTIIDFGGGRGKIEGEGNRRRRGINAEKIKSDCRDFFFFEIIHAPRERKEAGTMPPAARGAASPWFTGRAQKPADGEVSLNIF